MEAKRLYRLFRQFPAISTDTRAVKQDSLFFALRGEKFDGNGFAAEALEKGARYAIVDDPAVFGNADGDERYLLVPDALTALQDLALLHRQSLNIPVIGLTGSNGKTTTKELIKSVLATRYRVMATPGNLNNHIGVPLTLLGIHEGVEIAIIEMGANHIGEIGFLSEIAAPTHGLITNIGKAHLEGFGSFEGVKQAKSELYAYLAGNNGVLFIQGDNPALADAAHKWFPEEFLRKEALTYGPGSANRVSGEVVTANPYLILLWSGQGPEPGNDARENEANTQKTTHTLNTHLAGAYNLENVLAAIAVALHFGLSDEQIKAGIEDYKPSNNRSQIIDTKKGNRIIGDYYNANASSMTAALDNFRQLTDGRPKVLVLGDMFELGDAATEEHLRIIHTALATGPAKILFIGQHFYTHHELYSAEGGGMPEGAAAPATPDTEIVFVPGVEEAKSYLMDYPLVESLILLKGSRGIALEKLVDFL